MTNNDYFLKAAIKKVTEKLSEIVFEKIEEATNIAQDVPEIIKKEFDTLKVSIVEEAARMENEYNLNKKSPTKNNNQDLKITTTLERIEEINNQIDSLNSKINSQI